MGYRSDLTAGPGYGDEVYSIAPAAKESQRRPVLPGLTTKALTRFVRVDGLLGGASVG